ncbi:MAG: methyltransferase domain-containing protein [Desulfobacterales bacterium]|nr:methyltransferase domain-containing protein [Desulfobacterales bacterium]
MTDRDTLRGKHEIVHGSFLSQGDTERIWGWGTPAGSVRARRRADLIIGAAGLNRNALVLEVGCGTGVFTEYFADTGAQLIAVDISPELLQKARKRNLPAERVLFKESRFEDCDIDGPFDAVIGSSVLHHLDIEAALVKMLNLLKPGGFLCFAEPNAINPQVFLMFRFRSYFPEVSPDENPFLRWQLKDKLIRAGFDVPEIIPFDWLHPAIPPPLIGVVDKMGQMMEKIPFLREFAGSLLISARRPS